MILHYSLGFPPYRTGGLTKFCMDLMREQRCTGHTVALLWPGRMPKIGGKTAIKYGGKIDGIDSYEVVNPTPVPFDEGVTAIEAFTQAGDPACYEQLLNAVRPDVIHVHTLMGLHESLLRIAKAKGIRLVFTAHDFFPLCPKVTMMRGGVLCNHVADCTHCAGCNATALPLWKVQLLQSPLYRIGKDAPIVKKLRKSHRDAYFEDATPAETLPDNRLAEDYRRLREHFGDLLDYMDILHYNSTVTRDRYEQFGKKRNSTVLPISHADIADRRRERIYTSDQPLRLTYLGGYSQGKGWFVLREALDALWEKRQDFCLHLFFQPPDVPAYGVVHDRYTYDQLPDIFDQTDAALIPSVLYETFGYTALEAFSFGVPTIVTDHVGAKDVLPDGGCITVPANDADRLREAIDTLTPDRLTAMNKAILHADAPMTVHRLQEVIMQQCYQTGE